MDKIKYFLAIAEELNISKAAKRLYISQQSLSTYLKKLEDEYGVLLFNRKPKFSLTVAGESMFRTYQQIMVMHKRLKMELDQICNGSFGNINIGMNSGRSTMVMADILNIFWKKYPNISFKIIDGLTKDFELELLTGNLDFFIGVNPYENKAFKARPLIGEKIYLVVSDNILKSYFPNKYPECKQTFKKGVDIKDFVKVPFITNNEDSRVYNIFFSFLQKKNIQIQKKVATNTGALRFELSLMDYGVSICTQMRLLTVRDYNNKNEEGPKLNVFPIQGLDEVCETFIVYNEDFYRTKYMNEFLDCVIKYYNNLEKEISTIL